MSSVRSALIGLSLGLGIGGLLLGLIYFVPTHVRPWLDPEALFATEDFVFHYDKRKPVAQIQSIANQYAQDLRDLLSRLGMDRAQLPPTLHVFLHETTKEMRSSIVRRKQPRARRYYATVVDALYDEPAVQVLAEPIATLVWGAAPSRILTHGLKLYLADSSQRLLRQAMALPELLRFTLSEMRRLEKRGRIPPTVYEAFGAPHAPAALDISLLNAVFPAPAETETFPAREILTAETAAFVRFALEALGDWGKFRALWRAPSFESGLAGVYQLRLEQADQLWQQYLTRPGSRGAWYELQRGEYLSQIGRITEARNHLQTALASSETAEAAAAELQKLEFFAGRWEAAHAFGRPDLAGRFAGWHTRNLDPITLHLPPPSAPRPTPPDEVSQLPELLPRALQRLNMTASEIPERFVLFMYNGREEMDAATRTALSDRRRGVVALRPGESAGYAVLGIVLRRMSKDPPRSHVLDRGLAHYLGDRGRDYFAEAAALSRTERWIELARLDFDLYPNDVVQVEAAALTGYLLEQYGPQKLKTLWQESALLGGNRSLAGAVAEVYGLTLEALEADLVAYLSRR